MATKMKYTSTSHPDKVYIVEPMPHHVMKVKLYRIEDDGTQVLMSSANIAEHETESFFARLDRAGYSSVIVEKEGNS